MCTSFLNTGTLLNLFLILFETCGYKNSIHSNLISNNCFVLQRERRKYRQRKWSWNRHFWRSRFFLLFIWRIGQNAVSFGLSWEPVRNPRPLRGPRHQEGCERGPNPKGLSQGDQLSNKSCCSFFKIFPIEIYKFIRPNSVWRGYRD